MNSPTDALLETAIKLHRQGALDEAARGYQQVIAQTPGNADAYYYLAMVFYQQGHFDTSIAHAEKSLELNKNNARVLRLLGQAQSTIGQHTKALDALDRAIDHAPDMAEAHGARADVLIEL